MRCWVFVRKVNLDTVLNLLTLISGLFYSPMNIDALKDLCVSILLMAFIETVMKPLSMIAGTLLPVAFAALSILHYLLHP